MVGRVGSLKTTSLNFRAYVTIITIQTTWILLEIFCKTSKWRDLFPVEGRCLIWIPSEYLSSSKYQDFPQQPDNPRKHFWLTSWLDPIQIIWPQLRSLDKNFSSNCLCEPFLSEWHGDICYKCTVMGPHWIKFWWGGVPESASWINSAVTVMLLRVGKP